MDLTAITLVHYISVQDYLVIQLLYLNFHRSFQYLCGLSLQKEVTQCDLDLGEMNKLLLNKIKELTLDILEVKNKNQIINKKLQRHAII